MVYVVALTGGIASGKSTVSSMFEDLGVPVIDTDIIARQLSVPGAKPFAEIVDAFGETVLSDDGQLNRRALRRIVFTDHAKRQILEAILHPAIYAEVAARVAELDTGYCIVVIPLLAETGVPKWIDRVLTVDAEEGRQLSRLTQRDGVTEQQARSALASQASRTERLEIADDVIENNADIARLADAVRSLHEQYVHMSSTHDTNG